MFCRGGAETLADHLAKPLPHRMGIACLGLFFLPLARAFAPVQDGALAQYGAFYRPGALVFGGGHEVLPLLRDAVVARSTAAGAGLAMMH